MPAWSYGRGTPSRKTQKITETLRDRSSALRTVKKPKWYVLVRYRRALQRSAFIESLQKWPSISVQDARRRGNYRIQPRSCATLLSARLSFVTEA